MSAGLVIGRFCPPHKGHALVVERALAHVGSVVVLVFDARGCPWSAERRAGWLRRMFPSVRVVTMPDLPEAADNQWWRYELMFRRVLTEPVSHVFSSEPYGLQLAARLHAVSVEVDPGRRECPVSGTLVRLDPFKYREFLEPFVFEEITGAP